MFHERTKHIEIDCYVVRDKVLAKVIMLIHVRAQCQLVDVLTKALSFNHFLELISKMGLINIHLPSIHLEGEYWKKKPFGQAKSTVKEPIAADKLMHTKNRGSQDIEEQSTTCSQLLYTTCSLVSSILYICFTLAKSCYYLVFLISTFYGSSVS